MKFQSSPYSHKLYNPKTLQILVQKTASAVKKHRKRLKFDAIAVRGSSGAAIGFPVSAMTGIPLLFVRKSETSHADQRVEGPETDVDSYLIVDDFIATGSTVREIIKEIDTLTKIKLGILSKDLGSPKCVGVYCYNTDDDRSQLNVANTPEGEAIWIPIWS